MNKQEIALMLKLMQKLENAKKNKKMSSEEKLEDILNVFEMMPLNIKASLDRMSKDVINGMKLPKDFEVSDDARTIISDTLDRGDFDDLLINISGNFVTEDRMRLANAIVYKLNH